METRLIAAYALLALIAAGLAVGAWLLATRDRRMRKRRRLLRARWIESRAAASREE